MEAETCSIKLVTDIFKKQNKSKPNKKKNKQKKIPQTNRKRKGKKNKIRAGSTTIKIMFSGLSKPTSRYTLTLMFTEAFQQQKVLGNSVLSF